MAISLLAVFYFLLEVLLKPFLTSNQKAVSCQEADCVTSTADADASVCTEATARSTNFDEDCNSCESSFLVVNELSRTFLRNRNLILTDFVARSSPKDALELCQFLERHHTRSNLRSIVFRDTVHGSNYRRWLFKKTGLYRHVLNVADTMNIEVKFEASVEVSTDTMSPKAIVSLLEAFKVDADIKSLIFTGSLYYRDAMWIVNGLESLLQADRRHWKTVSLRRLQMVASSPVDARLARRSCRRALQKVASQRYISLQMD